ncbi:hypothetical protein BDN72DRAFT_956176, partial [Pluteus cervinus]
MEQCRPLLLFPSLTHLSLFFEDAHLSLVPFVLETITKLEVLILWEDGDNTFPIGSRDQDLRILEELKDPRVTYLQCDFIYGWEMGARGMMDPWAFAEGMVAQRRRELENPTTTMAEKLPAELGFLVFTMAFKSDPEHSLHLQLVAKRVHQWLIPFIYEVVIAHAERAWPPVELTHDNLPLYGRHVRHLLYRLSRGVSDSDIQSYITQCPNLQTLALWILFRDPLQEAIPFIEILTNLSHLTELSINLNLFPPTPSESLSQVLSRITHLDVVNALFTWEHCKPLLLFPSLTHLSVPPGVG